MRALYLMRHSLTEANERHLYSGSTDLPLTERGRQIARERREEAFEQEYNRFAENLDYTLNEEQYAQVVLCRDEAVQAGGFYELCRSSFAAGEE
jgi:hypothetical protein